MSTRILQFGTKDVAMYLADSHFGMSSIWWELFFIHFPSQSGLNT